MKRWIQYFIALEFALSATAAFAEGGLITQLETDHVDITTHFTGEQILFFGAMSGPGDVIVKVVSPAQDVAVSQKKQVGPVWLDGGRVVVHDMPGLCYLASTKPISQILGAEDQERYGLRLEHGLPQARTDGETLPGWERAFVRLKEGKRYYHELPSGVTLVKERLFFTKLDLPPKLPEGKYQLEAFLVRNGKIVAQQTSDLTVQEVSLERWVSNAAHGYPWVYGASFTAICMVLGLGLGMLLRRNKDD
jgi:uncharacterized protein (TIGR02186 family)